MRRHSVRDLTRAVLAPAIVDERTSVALLLLRVFVGVAFLFHGAGKTENLNSFAAEFQIPLAFAAAAAFTQVGGGLLLLLGLCTPASAVALAINDGRRDVFRELKDLPRIRSCLYPAVFPRKLHR